MSTIDPQSRIARQAAVKARHASSRQAQETATPCPTDSAALSGARPPVPIAARVAQAFFTAMRISAAMTPAPVAAPLSDADTLRALSNAASRGAEYHKDRAFHIPILMDATVKIDASQALKMLQDGKEKALTVKLPTSGLQPLRSRANAAQLEVFNGGGDPRNLDNPALGSLLADVEADGYALRTGAGDKDDAVGAYGAYNRLTDGWHDGNAQAWVWRDGVPLVALSADAGSHPVEVRDEIRRSRDALLNLQKPGDDEAKKNLALLQKPAGDASLATRAAVFDKLLQKRNDASTVRVDYNLIANSRRGNEKLDDVAGFFLTLVEKNPYVDTRDIYGAFNYMRTRLGGDAARIESFQKVYGETHDINATVKSMDVLIQPVRGESYADRESFLVADAHSAGAIMAYDQRKLNGEQALDDFAYVVNDLRPNETFTAVAGDYVAVMQGVEARRGEISQVRPAFRYLRDKLAGDAARAQDFRDIVRQLGTAEDSIRALEFLDKATTTVPRNVRKDVLVGLLETTHELEDAKQRYEQIERGLQPGEDFGALGKLYGGLMKDLGDSGYGRGGVSEAFDYVRKDLMGDADAVDRFRQVVREVRSYHEATTAYPLLRQGVRAESEADRVNEYMRVHKFADRSASDLYAKVRDNLLPTESLKDGVDQLEALHKALEIDRDHGDLSTAYVDLKQRLKSNPDEMKIFTRLMQKLESYRSATVARGALDKQVAGETFEAREKVLDQLVDHEKSTQHAASEGGQDYAAVVAGLVGSEALAEGAARFVALLSALRGEDAPRNARESFNWISDNFKNGNFGQKTANEVTAIMVESLLLSGDLASARNRALSGEKKSGTVEKQDDYVIIGGIRVPVQHNG